MKSVRYFVPLIIMALAVAMLAFPVGAAEFATPEMQRTWEYSDRPVADGQAVRSWIWGPEAFTPGIIEEYVEGSLSDGTPGHRLVQYHDKSRMEITNPSADKNSIWYVTNGLLATELTSGQMQVGNNSFVGSVGRRSSTLPAMPTTRMASPIRRWERSPAGPPCPRARSSMND